MEKTQIQQLVTQFPLVQELIDLKPVTWFNPQATTLQVGLPFVGLGADDVAEAEQRLARFAPYLSVAFPETQATKGVIESEVVALPAMQTALNQR
ncbi:MAG: D-serine dehydratase, partial [Serratia liquefaciens]|nr:D-serine dehydratase [Serratia liquefaciens]